MSTGANSIHRTVGIAVGTLAVGTAASCIRLGFAHKEGRALAAGAIRRDLTYGRRMTAARRTAALLNAGHLGQGIATISRWALAHGTMILGQANGILATGFLVADIVAGMGHTITHLISWTVMIVDAGYALAAVERIVGIACIGAWWTLALSLMIIRNADGTWSALDAFAGGMATQRLCGLVFDASLRFGTFCIVATLMFAFQLAAVTIVGIAHKSSQAITASLVMTSNTNGVSRTGESITNGNTLEYSQHVGATCGSIRAILIAGAVGQ